MKKIKQTTAISKITVLDDFSAKLLSFLLKGSFITPDQREEFENSVKNEKKNLEELLLEKEILSDLQLGQIIADLRGWRFVDLSREFIDESLVHLLSKDFAESKNVISFAQTDRGIKVALSNPDDKALLDTLSKKLKKKVIAYFATLRELKKSHYHYQKEIKSEFEKLIQAYTNDASHMVKADSGEAGGSAIVKIVDLLVADGYQKKASDIHIEPELHHTLVRFRIDGVMQDVVVMPKTIHDLIVTRVKILTGLRTDEHQAPQDGKFQDDFENEQVDIRVSILPTTKGENIVMRLLSEKSRRFSLEDLGLSEKNYRILRENIKKPWGMILATGPTGSGKTTSLYAILKILNRREVNIATIEDPVEYNIDNITQIQVNPRTQLNFGSGLRSIVRQDPNIIMVGEIRDEETASIAVNSAMTGHLVLSTLHTNDAATTLPRLLDMGVPPFLVSSTVNVAIAQRLVRKICQNCIMSYEIPLAELQKKIPVGVVKEFASGVLPDGKTHKANPRSKGKNILLYKGKGCSVCQNSGYNGRNAVFEILEMNDKIREMIMHDADADSIKAQAVRDGMITMFDDALTKVFNGITTIEEMLRVIKY